MFPVSLTLLSAGDHVPVRIDKARFTIGRDRDCDLALSNRFVSRNHCEIVVGGQDVWVRDEGSINGTFVNGERVACEQTLANGDILLVASVRLRVNLYSQPEPTESAAATTRQENSHETELATAGRHDG